MVNFFIDRPKFAWVIAIGISLFGLLSIFKMPIAAYPDVAPPSIQISASYPGASAETLQNTVVQPIEQALTGIDNLLYFSANSLSNGSAQITLFFDPGTDPNIAQVQAQNKVERAIPLLPTEVQQLGVTVTKSNNSFFMVAGFLSANGSMTRNDIADYVVSHIADPVGRLPGVGQVSVWGAQHAMRIWLEPAKLNSYGLTPQDVVSAVQSQNVQIASGELGGLPALSGQVLDAAIIGPQQFTTVQQFQNILLRVRPDGSQVLLKDVADVELGAQNYNSVGFYNGKPATGLAISLAPGANAIKTAAAVHAEIQTLEPFFPTGLQTFSPYDTTPFTIASLRDVLFTLIEAMALVIVVMLIFLQNLRATFIPAIAIPVVLLGTFGILHQFGFSINSLTMFATVLAIGLVVDDAIVVIENVERVMREERLSPREATKKSMKEIIGAMVGIIVVLIAVLLPMAFFAGSTGAIYHQFSITMVVAVLLSLLVAFVFTPSLCATMLKPVKSHEEQRGFPGWFNRHFDRMNRGYERSVWHVTGRAGRYFLIYFAIVAVMGLLYLRLPAGFLPVEDQGEFFVQVTAPPGATQPATVAANEVIEHYFLNDEKKDVAGVLVVAGFSYQGQGQNVGLALVRLKPWSERSGKADSAQAIVARANKFFSQYRDAQIVAFVPPSIQALGNATGFDLELLDQAGLSHTALMHARDQLLDLARKDPQLANVRPNGLNDQPMYRLEINWEKANALGVTATAINSTLQDAFGSAFANQFIDDGRIKDVYVQSIPGARMQPDQLDDWYVHNTSGGMVPMNAFTTGRWAFGSPKLERYNGVSSIEILGEPAPGYSTGQAMAQMEKLAARLPAGFGYAWTGISYQEAQGGSQTLQLYALSIFVVFLVLTALYESWSIPLSVILVVPIGIVGTILFSLMRGLDNDVFFQVGLLTTVGLAVKNAILIVQFAVQNMKAGQDLIPATAAASRQRLRPILMTSIAFICGVLPLAIASGAGASGRIAVGTGVIGGMVTATVLAIFFTPVFFVSIRTVALRKHAPGADHTRAAPDSDAGGLLPRRPLSGAPAPFEKER